MRPVLTDQDVRERMDWLTANGFPGTETVQRAKEFVKSSRGPVAEGAVRLTAGHLERGRKIFVVAYDTHALATAAGGGLEHDGIAD